MLIQQDWCSFGVVLFLLNNSFKPCYINVFNVYGVESVEKIRFVGIKRTKVKNTLLVLYNIKI